MKLPGRLGIYACAALLALMGCGSRTDGGAGALASQDAATDDDVAVAATDDATQDVATDVAQDVKQPVKTIGELVDPPLDPPTFTKVVDSTGVKVTPDQLQGHWTVLWFYPAASTAG